MKKHLQRLYFTGFLIITLVFTYSCTEKDEESVPDEPKTVISEWTGTFTGNIENGEIDFVLYSDNTITLTWETPNACCNSSQGTYTLNGNNLTFNLGGSATSGSESSNFTMSSNGTLNATSGNGSYSIVFNSQSWDNQSGNWDVVIPGTQSAEIKVVLKLPAEAEGKIAMIIFDNDGDLDNGTSSIFTGMCPGGLTVSCPFDDIPPGSYYIFAAVWVANDFGEDYGPGDFFGIYGANYPNNVPDHPNAIVPVGGNTTFTIDLVVISKNSNNPFSNADQVFWTDKYIQL